MTDAEKFLGATVLNPRRIVVRGRPNSIIESIDVKFGPADTAGVGPSVAGRIAAALAAAYPGIPTTVFFDPTLRPVAGAGRSSSVGALTSSRVSGAKQDAAIHAVSEIVESILRA